MTFLIDSFSDGDFVDYELEFDVEVEPCALWHGRDSDRFYARWWQKFKLIKKIIFNECLDLEQTYTFRGLKHVESFLEVIQQGLEQKKRKNKEIGNA